MISADDLIANYREWLGIPFLHQGRSRLGCDCLGFVAAGAAEVGSRVFLDHLPVNYARDPQSLLLGGLEALTREIELQPGALVVIQFPMMRYASHGAIFTGDSMIHSYQAVGRVVEHRFAEHFRQRVHSVWAIPMVRYS